MLPMAADEELTTVGDALHAAMFRRGDNQVEAAHAIGVTRQVVNDWIKGRRVPTGSTAKKAARYVGLTVDELRALCDRQTGRDINARLDALDLAVANLDALLRRVLAAVDQSSSPSSRSRAGSR